MSNLPRGLYDQIVDQCLALKLGKLDPQAVFVWTENLDPGDGHVYLAQHLVRHLAASLRALHGEESVERQIALCNQIVDLLNAQTKDQPGDDRLIASEAQRLLSVLDNPLPGQSAVLERPDTPLATGCLLTGTRLDPSLISQIRKEIASADRVDMLCSFIKWSGIRLLEEPLRRFTARENAQLRVITTSYMGATDLKAIDFLQQLPNTELRVSYDTHRTRLHAKAYLFHRKTGFGAAYVGSANLSNAALTDGLEWNIKVSQYEQGYLFDKVQATFETYWNDSEFQPYEAEQRKRLQQALLAERVGESTEEPIFFFDLIPHRFQEEILQRLDAERELQGRTRQLVVAATGTGKTVLSAFDYRRWCERRWNAGDRNRKRLLFVAHREEILRQAQATFRNVLHDANFGELMFAGMQPESRDQLFVSIQTFNSQNLMAQTPADYYDYIVIDEFHHAAAPSYQDLLEHFQPQVLLGLTATPERMDGLDVLAWFDGHLSAEIRLPDAINNKHLAPFQYFCISDNVDLSQMRWQRGKYDVSALSNVYTGDDIRAGLVIEKVHQVLTDVRSARGLGFCVSVDHARHMARKFNEAGIPAESLDADSAPELRRTVQGRLREREINFIFVVDLYNEGVDIPEVDTVLFLRPTESLTVFLQQLGRGLRLSEGKECLTVLDFIGQAHQNYRFDQKFRGLLTDRSRRLDREIESGFPHLPAGCAIQMEKIAQRYILDNIRHSLRSAATQLVQRLAKFEQETGKKPTLASFLEYYDLNLDDIYRRNVTWSRLCVRAKLREDFAEPYEEELTSGLRRIAHINDTDQIQFLFDTLELQESGLADLLQDEILQRRLLMLQFSLWGKKCVPQCLQESITRLKQNPTIVQEFQELLNLRLSQIASVPPQSDLPFACPLQVHGLYTRDELLAALGHWTLQSQPEMREGVRHLPDLPADVLLTTLNKTDHEFSPTTMYEDYAISETLFHWQSQSTTSDTSPTGQRYIEHEQRHHHILLFVRENKKQNGLACPFYFLGSATYISHQGSCPMSITWRLQHPMPAHLLRQTSRLAVA